MSKLFSGFKRARPGLARPSLVHLSLSRLSLGMLGGLLLLTTAGCSQTPVTETVSTASVTLPSWQAPERQQHPLVGTLYQLDSDQPIAPETLLTQLPAGTWLLLGEQHDHPDHQQLQLWVLQQLAAQQRLGAVAMEMLNTAQQPALDAKLKQSSLSTPEELNWPEQAWPFARYQKQVYFALEQASRLVAADLSDNEKTALRQNTAAVQEHSAAHTDYLAELMVKSHCGMFTAERAKPAARMQIGRDQQMAKQMLANSQADKINVLIAGAQHARKDIGIPLWLGEQPVVSILMISVAESTDPKDYLPQAITADTPASAIADLVWFVPALPAVDYCAQLKSS